MKLTTRLTAFFLLLTTVPLVVVGSLAYGNGRQTIEQNMFSHLISTNILKEHEFNRWIEGDKRQLRELAQRPLVREYAAVLASQSPTDPAYQAAYEGLIKDHLILSLEEKGGFLDLSILRGENGLILISTDKRLEGKYKESESFFLEGRSRTFVQNVSYSLSHGEIVMHISTPIVDREGNLIAVLSGHADLAEMSGIMEQRSGLSDSEDTYLVNSFNFFVTEPRFGEGYALKKAVHTAGVEACLDAQSRSDDVGFYDDYRSVPVIGAYHWLEERELCILTEVDQAEAYAPTLALRNVVLSIGVIVLVMATVVGAVLARAITGPLGQLAEGAEEIGRGNLEYRIKVRTRDEIGRLATAFNDMAANLRLSLGETAHGQRLLLALSQAAQSVQRARTPDEIYRTIGDEVVGLGYDAAICTLTNDRTHLVIPHMTFKPTIMQAAEKLTGLPAQNYCFPLVPGGLLQRIVAERETAYIDSLAEPMAEALPRPLRPLAGRLAGLMGTKQAIYAPLMVGGEMYGLLMVTGANLTEADVPAISVFANQAAIALENTRLYQQVQRHAEELEQRVAERTKELASSQAAAMNMMEDSEEARRATERANEDLTGEIAARKQAEEELKRHRDHLEELVQERTRELHKAQERLIRQEKLAVLGQLAGGVGHELRNPLGAIKNAAYFLNMVLTERELEPEVKETLEILEREVGTSERIISSLLDYARAKPPSRRKVDLNDVVREALSRAPLFGAPRVEAALQLDEELPLILADPDQLSQVLDNVIRNGIQAMIGSGQLTIRTAVESPEWVTVSVADTGEGISEENLEKIFEPLFTTKAKGIGLGLALVKTMVEGHGGTIEVESPSTELGTGEVGKGSIFTVRLPVGISHEGE